MTFELSGGGGGVGIDPPIILFLNFNVNCLVGY
jgi:hypothetical protein